MQLNLPRPLAVLLLLSWSALLFWLLVSRDATRLALAGSGFVNNLAHAGLFGVEALLLGAWLAPGRVNASRRLWLMISLLALSYAGLLEWLQGFSDGRRSSWLDMLTNTVGVFVAPRCLASWPLPWRTVSVATALALGAAALATWGPDV